MSNAAILYLRLLRRIVRESAWRLGGAEESFLAEGLSGSDTSASQRPEGRDRWCTRPVLCGGPVEGDTSART